MPKKLGDWNQCRCGEGYQETQKTIKQGCCQDCIDWHESRERQYQNDVVEYGCPFCLDIDCPSAIGLICPDTLRRNKQWRGLTRIAKGFFDQV